MTNSSATRFPASPADAELHSHYDAMRSALISVNISRGVFRSQTEKRGVVIAGAFAAGVARFRQAMKVAPNDLISTYNLAQAMLELDPDEHRDEADQLLLQVIEAQPYGELANKAKDLRGTIAARDLRDDQPEGLRQDAVSYCRQALQLFEGMDQQRFIAVLSEVAAVGQGGLQINEPGTACSLKNLPGSWSDLALACLIHVGMKRLTPDQDSGLGIEAEYQEAVRLQGL